MAKSIIPVVDPPALAEGMVFESTSSYRLERRLGEGGMGEVWLAERVSAGEHPQKVAIKFLNSGASGKSLAAEALRMSRFSHDNIVPFIDSGRDASDRYFVAMAFIDGVDLEALRAVVGISSGRAYSGRAETRAPETIVGFIVFMVLRALQYAHEFDFGDGIVGLVHRDVSPGNILIDEARGFVKLTDFGVAVRQCDEDAKNEIAGKVPYMAPEVLTGDPADARSDIYALGLVAYELLTGFNPNIHPSNLSSVIGAITAVMLGYDRQLYPPHEVVEGIDPRISEIVLRMLMKDPAERYSSAEEVIADVSYWLYHQGVGPTTASLATYMELVRNPATVTPERARRALPFLPVKGEGPIYQPPWKLTDRAREAIDASTNPCRAPEPR